MAVANSYWYDNVPLLAVIRSLLYHEAGLVKTNTELLREAGSGYHESMEGLKENVRIEAFSK